MLLYLYLYMFMLYVNYIMISFIFFLYLYHVLSKNTLIIIVFAINKFKIKQLFQNIKIQNSQKKKLKLNFTF